MKAIITGASRGIGLAIANNLLSKGYQVIGTCRSGKINEIENLNFECLALDLSNSESIKDFAATIEKDESRINLLINNVGIGPDLDFEYPETKSFDSTFKVNVKGTVQLTELLIKRLERKGRILNVSSKMGSIEYCLKYDSIAYRMSKSALNMYTKILSNRMENEISVASIHPGWVKTTIAKSNVNGRLTPYQSADRIVEYLEKKFKNGEFWDAERNMKLNW